MVFYTVFVNAAAIQVAKKPLWKRIWQFIFCFIYLLYLFGCVGSQLQHVGSLMWLPDSLVEACRLSSCGAL